jgi:hypothetical protein
VLTLTALCWLCWLIGSTNAIIAFAAPVSLLIVLLHWALQTYTFDCAVCELALGAIDILEARFAHKEAEPQVLDQFHNACERLLAEVVSGLTKPMKLSVPGKAPFTSFLSAVEEVKSTTTDDDQHRGKSPSRAARRNKG